MIQEIIRDDHSSETDIGVCDEKQFERRMAIRKLKLDERKLELERERERELAERESESERYLSESKSER